MLTKVLHRIILSITAAPLIGLFGGCSGCVGPDNPKIAEAPVFTPPADPEPPKVPGRKDTYGANQKYQEAMERMGRGESAQ